MVPLPATARMPSRFQRHWLRYCAAGALVLYGGIFIVRHSRLTGSDDLDRCGEGGRTCVGRRRDPGVPSLSDVSP
jgi:hypothetical protein